MNQREVKKLLEEAAQPDCSDDRIRDIHVLLSNATAARGAGGIKEIDGPEAGLDLVVGSLFVDTIEHRRHLLPSLFPVFAFICGDREEGVMVTDVDWSLA
jgi:hypothetical protein